MDQRRILRVGLQVEDALAYFNSFRTGPDHNIRRLGVGVPARSPAGAAPSSRFLSSLTPPRFSWAERIKCIVCRKSHRLPEKLSRSCLTSAAVSKGPWGS